MKEKNFSLESFVKNLVQSIERSRFSAAEKLALVMVVVLTLTACSDSESEAIAPTAAQECANILLLDNPGWNLKAEFDATEAYQEVNSDSLVGMDRVNVTVDFHGNEFITAETSNDATALIFDDNGGWYTHMLAHPEFNGFDGAKVISIPLSAFKGVGPTAEIPFSPEDGVGTMHTRIWMNRPYEIDITNITAYDAEDPACAPLINDADYVVAEPILESSPAEVEVPGVVVDQTQVTSLEESTTEHESLKIKSFSNMKMMKDRVRDPLMTDQIRIQLAEAAALGATMISLETPYDNPEGGDSVTYTHQWITAAREQDLAVWHRHMFLSFEGIYDQPIQQRMLGDQVSEEIKSLGREIASVPVDRLDQYLIQMHDYILSHPDMFKAGDIFTPSPEPDARGVVGMSGCDEAECMFKSIEDFNQWLIDADAIAEEAFAKIGLADGQVRVGLWGFSGFTVAGLNNSDWEGQSFLECQAIESMDGVVAIDHYAQPEQMQRDLEVAVATLEEKCPEEFENVAIGEYGSTDPAAIREAFTAFENLNIDIINYWVLTGGDTGLIEEDGTPTERHETVKEIYSK